MLPLFLASVASLFPSIELPVALGWKTLSVFDGAFALLVLWTLWARPFHRIDRRLAAAAALFCASAWLGWSLQPSAGGLRNTAITTYSVLVFLIAAHLRVEAAQVRRLILWPLGVALAVAWGLFGLQNVFGLAMEQNISFALPDSVRRLGGFSGGPALVLFLAMALPFSMGSRLGAPFLLLSGFATLSRAMAGIGVAALLSRRGGLKDNRRGLVTALAAIAIGLSLFAYWFALVPADPARRQSLSPSFEPGAYRTLHTVVVRAALEKPWLGHGPARFIHEFRSHSSKAEQDLVGGPRRLPYWDPHSAILGLAVEQGLLGLALFGWLCFEVHGRVRGAFDPEFRSRGLAALMGLLVGGYFVDWFPLKGLWLWTGLLVAASRPMTPSPSGEQTA